MTTALQCINSKRPYTLTGFEPGIFCSVGGRDDHYTTPQGENQILLIDSKNALAYYNAGVLCSCQFQSRRIGSWRPLFLNDVEKQKTAQTCFFVWNYALRFLWVYLPMHAQQPIHVTRSCDWSEKGSGEKKVFFSIRSWSQKVIGML
jgi:hypothetical protein